MNPRYSFAWITLLPSLVFAGSLRADLASATDYSAEPWTSGGTYYDIPGTAANTWADQAGTTLDGVDAAETIFVGPLNSSWIETTVSGPAVLYFSWRVHWNSQATGGDVIKFEVTNLGVLATKPSVFVPDAGWKEGAITVPSGVLTVRWKISTTRYGLQDRVELDQVWTSDDPRPRIIDASNKSAIVGTPYLWNVPTNGSGMSFSASGLPPGLEIDPSGGVSGIPTTAGSFAATITVQNAAGSHRAVVNFEIGPGTTSIPHAFDAPQQTFETPDSAKWDGITGIGHTGNDSVRCRPRLGGAGNLASLSTQVQGPGTLSFWCLTEFADVSPIPAYSEFGVLLDGETASFAAGSIRCDYTQWRQNTVIVPNGLHTITWRCDVQGLPNLAGYLDEFVFTPAPSTSIPEGFDAPQQSFSTTFPAKWDGVVGFGHTGDDSVRCRPNLGDTNGPVQLSTQVTGPGTLTFWCQTESAAPSSTRFDIFRDTTSQFLQSCSSPTWSQVSLRIGSGTHTIIWQCVQTGGSASVLAGYLDEFTFTPISNQPQSTYAAWLSHWGMTGLAANADPDGDGMGLLLEYAFGGNPFDNDRSLWPVVSVIDGHLTIEVKKSPSPTDLIYLVESSVELTSNSWTTFNTEVLDENGTHLLARCKKSITEQPRCHLRVKVIVSP